MTDDQSAHCRSQDRCELKCSQSSQKELGQALYRVELLTYLCALEVVPAMQAGAEYKVALLQSASADKDIKDFFLNRIHGRRGCEGWRKKQKHFARSW